MSKQKGKSPYQKYGKKPYRYSNAYKAWFDAIKAGRPATELGLEHTRLCLSGKIHLQVQ